MVAKQIYVTWSIQIDICQQVRILFEIATGQRVQKDKEQLEQGRIFNAFTNLDLQRQFHNELTFNDVYSGNCLHNIKLSRTSTAKNGVYNINLDGCESIGTHWVALYANGKTVTYFDSFGVEDIPNDNKNIIGNKNKYLQKTSL